MRQKTGNGNAVDLERFLDDIKTVVRDGEELLKAGVAGVKEKAIARARDTDRVVREHPYQTIGVIFGLGVLLGVLSAGLLRRGAETKED